MDEFTLALQKPIELGIKGELKEVTSVHFTEPTARMRKHTNAIRLEIVRALKVFQKMQDDGDVETATPAPEDAGNEDVSADALLAILSLGEADFDALEDSVIEICKAGYGKVEGEVLSGPFIDKLSDNDLRSIVVEFCANFIMPYLMPKAGNI